MLNIELKQITSQQSVKVFIWLETPGEGPAFVVSKKWNFNTSTVGPAQVIPNVQFNTCFASEACEIADWWHIAAETAETLDRLFQTRDDLKRRISVRLVSRTVTVQFVDEESAADDERR